MSFFKKYFGLLAILFLSLVPVVFWFVFMSLPENYSGFSAVARSVGKILGLFGVSLFSLNLVISARFKLLDDIFYGINRAYINHHLVGTISFISLLFHPLFLAIQYSSLSVELAAGFLLFGLDQTAILFGKISLFLMLVLLVITYYAKIRYQVWRWTHKFLGLAFLFAGLHVFFIQSDVAVSQFLRWYILTLIAFGVMSYVYRSVLGRLLVKKLVYFVKEIRPVNQAVVEIVMSPQDKKLNFKPGQFVFLNFDSDGVSKEIHPFSITSSVGSDSLEIAVKSLGDYTSNLINSLKTGSKVFVEGPYGKFSPLDNKNRKQIWIAGGIGITPFLDAARNLSEKEKDFNIDLYYSFKNEKEGIFLNELLEVQKGVSGFKVMPFNSEKEGKLTADFVARNVGSIRDRDVYICGPAPMMKDIRKQFLSLGVSNDKIYSEEFSFN